MKYIIKNYNRYEEKWEIAFPWEKPFNTLEEAQKSLNQSIMDMEMQAGMDTNIRNYKIEPYIKEVQKEDYLHHLLVNIAKHENYYQDTHNGAIYYSTLNNDDIYCTPAWLNWEDSTLLFPEDDNFKIYVQFEIAIDNDYYNELNYFVQYDIEKDLENYFKIMSDFLSKEDNF